jgi:hypothetical protein
MRYILLTTILVTGMLVCNTCHASDLPKAARENSNKYLKVREKTNNNDAPEIDMFLAAIGLPKGLSWCCAFALYNYKEAADLLKVKQPFPKYGRVSMLWEFCKKNPTRYQTFTAEQVRMGLVQVREGDLVIFKNGPVATGNFNGHIGIAIVMQPKNILFDVEGNTLPEGVKGNQREGGGVYQRHRYLSPGTFSIIGFIRPL